MDRYCIKDGYRTRRWNRFFDDTALRDEWQDEVYAKAKELADQQDLKSVLDLGTGSGFKLLKYFGDRQTLGIDLPKTVRWLNRTYPDRQWSDRFEPHFGFDLVVCADMIEHVPDPDRVL